jgi:hypothetical protein
MRIRTSLVLCVLVWIFPLHAEVITGTDEMASLPFWEWRNDYMSLRLVQRLPDQSRAYFAGRGFQGADVETIAGHCVFQTVYKNISTASHKRVIEHDIRDWRVHYEGKTLSIMPREDWQPIWRSKGIAQAQIVAFEWSLLPTKQRFEAGDYNWGMTFVKVPHGASFDLDIHWKVDGKPQTARMKNVTCAKDVYIPPQ